MSEKRKSQKDSASEELNWATGLSRWLAYKQSDLNEIDDPALVRWVDNQRKDYWRWKQGHPSTMEKEAFDMLGNFGFVWGEESQYEVLDEVDHDDSADEEEDATTDEDEDLDRKPRARPTKANAKAKGKRSKRAGTDDEEDENDDDESEPSRKMARTSKTRKSPRDCVRSKDARHPSTQVDDKPRRSSRSSTATQSTPAKRGRKPSMTPRVPKEESELRTMLRIVPIEEEPQLIEKVKEECKDLLMCAEPLEEDKENGVHASDVRVNKAFETKFLEFLVFCRAYGHAYVPKIFPENPSLGRWCCKLRHWRNTNSPHLTDSRFNRLEAAGFVWQPKSDKQFWRLQTECAQAIDLWEENFQDLLKFKAERGHVLVPKEYQENKRLARWVLKQRRNYKAKHAGEYHTLDDEKEQRLIDVGFVFNSRTPELMRQNVFDRFKDRWQENIDKLTRFREMYGHGAIPRRWKTDPSLSSWAMRQRAQWRKLQAGQNSYLTPERLAELEAAGFVFGNIDRRDYPVDECGVWPKPYQLKKRKRRSAKSENDDEEEEEGEDDDDEEEEENAAEEAANVVASTLGTGTDEDDAGEDGDGDGETTDGETSGPEVDNDQETPDENGDQGNNEENDTVAEVLHEEEQEEPEPVAPTLIKGRWVCSVCSKDEFLHFVDACAHEAACSGMQFALADVL